MTDPRICELRALLEELAGHLRELETRRPRRPYVDDPQPYAWREIIAATDYMLDPDDGAELVPGPAEERLVWGLSDVLAALDEAAPADPGHPSRQALERAWAWVQASASPAAPPGHHLLRLLDGWLPIPIEACTRP